MIPPDTAGQHGPTRENVHTGLAFLGHAIGQTRFIVLLAVLAVLLAALSLFVLGTVRAITSVGAAWMDVFQGQAEGPHLTAQFLEIVNVMLEAVIFYLIGVGLFSLFIAPLNLAIALGVETLHDLEAKVISVVIAIMAVTFLEHFVQWKQALEVLQFGGALAVTVMALVLSQIYHHRVKEDQKARSPNTQARSQQEMFEQGKEQHEFHPDEVGGDKA